MIFFQRFASISFYLLIGMILGMPATLCAQNAPATTIAKVGNAIPGQVDVPVTVTGFNDIGAISLTIDYPYAGLHFVQGAPNSNLDGFAIGDHDLGNGYHRITMGWFGSGVSLADNEVIMTITFTFISGITALDFYDNGPSCEYANGSYDVLNDLPQPQYYINGSVCGEIGNPGPISGDASVCKGETGVSYSVSPVTNATSYHWTVPAGANIVSGNGTNAILVDFPVTASSGNITVNGSNLCGPGVISQLPVSVNIVPVANAGSDVTIPYGTSTTLHAASGGTGSFSYHWSPEALLTNPNLQNPLTVNLTVSEVFTLLVSNLGTQCTNSDEVAVTVSGGPINTNPVSIPTMICRGETAQLFANAGGGSGTYSYAWSCTPAGTPPWSSTLANPLVMPDSTKVYHLSLSDGFNSIQGSTTLVVNQLPKATISGGDTLCGEGNSTVLTVNLTGVAPWSFYYSNGITTWFVPNVNTTPYSIVATDPGVYTILAMSDAQCIGTAAGSAVVGVFPVPPAPVISVNGAELFSSGCCGNQWYRDGVLLPGATGTVYQPNKTAHYWDIVTVNGCSSDTSNDIYYVMASIGKPENVSFSIEPNPANDDVTIMSKNGTSIIERIEIFSTSGKTELTYVNVRKSEEVIIDIRRLSPGLYFLSVKTTSGKTVLKLMVQ
ncbi:MAG: T9SS type A sorting domain-containing protein [Bacteroidales bacterium]